jgi:hypothetical protein
MRLFHLTFDLPLERRDIAGFRAAVARAAGLEHDLFHNHDADGAVQYRYPVVQYRSERGQAAIVGIDAGGMAMFEWFSRFEGPLLWNDAEHPLRIRRMNVSEHAIQFNHDEPHTYRLYQWLPLDQKRYRDWMALPDLKTRAEVLDRTLVAHILTFCRAVNWRLPERLEANIASIGATYRTQLLGNHLVALDVTFRSNLRLPAHIGLGKGVSHGFGVCRPERGRRADAD